MTIIILLIIFNHKFYNLDKLNSETQEEMGDDESHGGEFSVHRNLIDLLKEMLARDGGNTSPSDKYQS